MAVVGTHALKPFTLPVAPTPPSVQVRNNDNLMRQGFNAHDADSTIHNQSGLLASRPATAPVGTVYYATNSGSESVAIYTATGWVTIAGVGVGLTGSGTAGRLAKWTSASVLGDSIVSESGSVVTVTGELTATTQVNTQRIRNAGKVTVEVAANNVFEVYTNTFLRLTLNGPNLIAGTLLPDATIADVGASGTQYRDGWFSGTVTAAGFSGPLSGSATTLATSRNFSLTGDVTASAVAFNGSADVALSTTLGTVGVAKGGTGLTATPTNGQLLIGNGTGYTLATLTAGTGVTVTNGVGTITIAAAGGDVTGPASATDNAVARFDLTTGKLIQNSAVTIADTGAMSIAAGSASPALTVTTTGTDALRLAYDGSNRADFRVDSSGQCVLIAGGSNASFSFGNRLLASLTASANYTLDFSSTSSAGTSNALGLRMTAINSSTSGTVLARAMQASVSVSGAGGTTTNAIAIQANVSRTNGTLTNGYGLYVDAISGTMTNAYGIRVFGITGGSSLNYAIYTESGLVRFGDTVNIATTNGLQVNGTKVVGAQGATVADPAGGGTIDAEARTAINDIIDRLQAHGLIA